MARKATAHWQGGGKDGKGHLKSASGALDADYGAASRFGEARGTNPEELLAAAHAGCFTMALAFALEKAGFPAQSLDTEAAVTLKAEGNGFRITRSALALRAQVPGIGAAQFEDIAQDARVGCPVSRLFDAEITLDAALV